MTRETKAGLLMILMLAGVFGFMVYKRMHQPAAAMAQQNPPAVLETDATSTGTEPSKPVNPFEPDEQVAAQEPMGEPTAKPTVAAQSEFEPSDEDERFAPQKSVTRARPNFPTEIEEPRTVRTAQTEFSEPTARVTATRPVASRTIPDPEPAEESNPFDPQPTPTTAARSAARTQVVEPVEVADEQPSFDSPSLVAPVGPRELPSTDDAFPKPTRPSVGLNPPAAIQQSSSIEFAPPETRTEEKDPFGADTELQVQTPPKRSRNEFAQDTSAAFEPQNTPVPTPNQDTENAFESPPEKPQATTPVTSFPKSEPKAQAGANDPFGGFQPATPGVPAANAFANEERPSVPAIQRDVAPRRTAAPAAQIDDDFGSRPTGRPLIAGDTYQIEHGDNYWTISRKKYGVGKYFMALAQHNAQIITDPKRMKLGATISTPAAELLERTYPQLIPKAVPIDPVQTASTPAGTIKTVAAAPVDSEAEAGFFVIADGTPMYRIGREDTLSGIAQRHLGRSSRWMQVFELNRDVLTDGNTLKIGATLRLPADASRVDVVGNPRTFR